MRNPREILENGRAATVSTLPENTAMQRVIAALGYEELGVAGDGAVLENYLS